MAHIIYAYFKPQNEVISKKEAIETINRVMPGTVEESKGDDSISFSNNADGRLIFLSYSTIFPYWHICAYGYWPAILEGKSLRKAIGNICRTLGANEWWYIEEVSTDLIEELIAVEFEELLLQAPEIEDFEQPTFFPNSPHHLFRDSTDKLFNE